MKVRGLARKEERSHNQPAKGDVILGQVHGDHPLDLAMGQVAGEGGLKSVFWSGEYRHGPDVYTEAIVLQRPGTQSLEMTAVRHRDIAGQVLDGIESLWCELESATGSPAFTCIQRDYWA